MKTYEEIMKNYDEKVTLAMSKDTLPEVLSDLATAMFTYPDTRLINALLDNPSTPVNVKAQIAFNSPDEIDKRMLFSIARNPDVSEDVLNTLIDLGNVEVIAAVASNPSASQNILETLARHSYKKVRMNVVKNPNASAIAFIALIGDRDKSIADEACRVMENNPDLFEKVIRSQALSYIPNEFFYRYIEIARSYGNDRGDRLETILMVTHDFEKFYSLPKEMKEDIAFLKDLAFLTFSVLKASEIARNNKEVVLEAAKSYKAAPMMASLNVQEELYLDMLDDNNVSYDELIKSTTKYYGDVLWQDHAFLERVMEYDVAKNNPDFILAIRSKIDSAIRHFWIYDDYSDKDIKKLVESWYMVNDRLKSINDREKSDDENSDNALM